MNSFTHKHCVPCEGGEPAATADEVQRLSEHVPDWVVREQDENGKIIQTLQRTFQFADFREAMSFLRQVEDIAEAEGHHPDFCVHYNRVDFILFTHAVGGLHENDFILAAKIDEISKIR